MRIECGSTKAALENTGLENMGSSATAATEISDLRPDCDDAQLADLLSWAAQSRALDAYSVPLLLFHGTATGGFARFAETGGKRRGDVGIFATTNIELADSYARPKDTALAAAMGVKVDVEKVVGSFELRDQYTREELSIWYGFEITESADKVLVYTPAKSFLGAYDDETAALRAASARAQSFGRRRDHRIGTYSLCMNIQNPLFIDGGGANWNALAGGVTTDTIAIDARRQGYDGVVFKNVIDSGGWTDSPCDIHVAFDPKNVRIVSPQLAQALEVHRAAARQVHEIGRAKAARKAIARNSAAALDPTRTELHDLIVAKTGPGARPRSDLVAVVRALSDEELPAVFAQYESKPYPVEMRTSISCPHVAQASAPVKAPPRESRSTPSEWFAGSVVTDTGKPGGQPLRVFHGTNATFDEYRRGRAGRGLAIDTKGAIFFTSSPEAAGYHTTVNRGKVRGEDAPGSNIRVEYLAMKDPFEVNFAGGFKNAERVASMIADAKANKNDGVILRNVIDAEIGTPADVFIAFSPAQIRSAFAVRPEELQPSPHTTAESNVELDIPAKKKSLRKPV